MDKVRYFLKTFKSVEWSGPAWYSHVKDENGFPSIVTLEYWHPLDLGTAANTDWDGEDLIKIYSKLRKKYPEIGKSWVQGNIHSHHSMGAFFSGTDEQQCIDGANEHFYYSLVVSTKPEKEFYFGFSYPDQYGQIDIKQGIKVETNEAIKSDTDWEEQQKLITKRAEKETPTTTNLYRYNKGTGMMSQGTLFENYNNLLDKKKEEEEQDKYEDYCDVLSYGRSFGISDDPLDYTDWLEYDNIMLDWERGRIKTKQRNKKLKKLGVDQDGRPLSTQ